MTMASAVAMALRENPRIRALEARWEAMRERPARAGALPNPMLTYSAMDGVSGGAWPDTNEKYLMIQQELPAGGKRGLRADMARKDAEAARADLDTLRRDVALSVKEDYLELHAVRQVMIVTRAEEEVLQRMAKIAETLYATGERAQQDVLKAKSEITLLRQRLLELDARGNTLRSDLNTLLNRRPDAPLGTAPAGGAVGAAAPEAGLVALALTNRPEIRAAEAQAGRYGLERQLMDRETLPDYRLGLEYRNIGNNDDMVMVTVGVDLPLWHEKNRAGVREAERMQAASRADREAAERQAARDVQDAAGRLTAARRTLELYRTELVPQAEARFRASEAAYRTGKADFMDFLESQRFLLDARVMAIMAESDAGVQHARLTRAVGVDPEAGGAE
jgi:outer membrane protein TolC